MPAALYLLICNARDTITLIQNIKVIAQVYRTFALPITPHTISKSLVNAKVEHSCNDNSLSSHERPADTQHIVNHLIPGISAAFLTAFWQVPVVYTPFWNRSILA
jgi:hypothetical protein